MTTTTTNAPAKQRKPRAKPARFIRVLEQPTDESDGWAAIQIMIGKQVDTYLLHAVPTDFGNGFTGFEVEKLTPGFETAEVYHVLLADRPEDCSCDCRGHERWSHCKHREGIETLVKVGKLPAKPAYRSAGDMARNDPASYEQHQADTAKLAPMRAKDAYCLDRQMDGDGDLPPAA